MLTLRPSCTGCKNCCFQAPPVSTAGNTLDHNNSCCSSFETPGAPAANHWRACMQGVRAGVVAQRLMHVSLLHVGQLMNVISCVQHAVFISPDTPNEQTCAPATCKNFPHPAHLGPVAAIDATLQRGEQLEQRVRSLRCCAKPAHNRFERGCQTGGAGAEAVLSGQQGASATLLPSSSNSFVHW